ncbi:NACHT, LRR and PYD domains-containing protein 12 [Echeneis naucrates]|uniref:NACHT, LRR and PYD domains-containing protein 12 n=1 Tax=Echeneis naucrates TaxID=173247 RepID=UPI001113B291|nr:NACHT, LRR and PYD domains-containing protein 12-like [Echeneis naucrates]
MDKDTVLTHILKPQGLSTLLGGEPPVSVINSNRYISQLAGGDRVADINEDDTPSSLDHAILTALSAETKTVILMGPEGSGKTTALEKLVLDWAKGDHLQNLSFVFYFRLREMNSLEAVLSLETLMQNHHSRIPPECIPPILQKPEEVLFVFDDLDRYKYNLNPSVHTLCSDPSQAVSVSCLIASLFHGSLLKGSAFVVATRPTKRLTFLKSTQIEMLGFLKPQRAAYFNRFFTDPAAANKALVHMERTLGFYDFCTSPRFCWTVCSIYKTLMDARKKLPETLSQVCIDILTNLIQALSLNKACSRQLVLALGRMAPRCFLSHHSSCTREELNSFGFQQFLTSVGVFLRVDGNLDSDTCVFSFTSQQMQEFILAMSFFLDKSTGGSVEKMFEEQKGRAKFLDLFLSGLSEPIQRRPLETLLGEFDPDQIMNFKSWFKSSSEEALKAYEKDRHIRFYHMLHQAQNENLVKEIITPSARTGLSYGGLSLQDSVSLNYVMTCLTELIMLNLYRTENFTEEQAEVLVPAMSLSHQIILSDSSLSVGAVLHLASAISRGVTKELDLGHAHLGEEKFKILCAGLRDSKLQNINLTVCGMTETSCEDLGLVLTSGSSQLRVCDISFNKVGDQGLMKLCKSLSNPQCKLQKLKLQGCELTAASMEALSAALCSGCSELMEVDLIQNRIGDSGVEALSKALKHPLCKLQNLKLFDNEVTGACCSHLMESLRSEHCVLSELDLSVNELGQKGGLLLCQALSQLGCPLKKLGLKRCELTRPVFEELGSVLSSGNSKLESLLVGMHPVGDQGVKPLLAAVAHPNCLLEELDVEMTNLTDACVVDLCAAIRASKTLKNLELSNNSLTDVSVPALIQVMEDSPNMQELRLKYNDFSEDVLDMIEECGKVNF